MAEITLSVNQIVNLGLWERVCDYKGDEWILNEGKIDEDELVTFDDEFKKEEEVVEESNEQKSEEIKRQLNQNSISEVIVEDHKFVIKLYNRKQIRVTSSFGDDIHVYIEDED